MSEVILDGADEENALLSLAAEWRHRDNLQGLVDRQQRRDEVINNHSARLVDYDPKLKQWINQPSIGGMMKAEPHTANNYVGLKTRLSRGKIASFDSVPAVGSRQPDPHVQSFDDVLIEPGAAF